MKRYFLGLCLILLGSSASSMPMFYLRGEPAEAFLGILENKTSPTDVPDNLMNHIGSWLSANFDLDQYNALPNETAKRQFLYALFPNSEKYFEIGGQTYCICMARKIPSAYSRDEAGILTRLPDLPDAPRLEIIAPQPDNSAHASSTASRTFERVSDTLYPIIQSPYFKASCAAAISGIITYYAIGWSNKNKAERRKRSQKKWALCSAVVVGIGSFNYFDNH